MIIKNFKELATTNSRKDALEIINSGIESVLVGNIIENKIKVLGNKLKIKGKTWKVSKGHVYVVGAGKAAADMAKPIEKKLGKFIKEGILIDTRSAKLKKIKVVKGTHPLPSKVNLNATKRIVNLLKKLDENDLVIYLASGGGSVLLSYPHISLDKLIKVNKLLLRRGAKIEEINTVRKHISKIKGGQLSQLAGKSKVISLIVSDVMTNDLDVISSGPTVLDPTTVKDAEKIQKMYRLPKLPFVETPKKKLTNTTNILIITNVIAAKTMENKAKSLGYKTKILTTGLKGEARNIGKKLSKEVSKGKVLIAAGETTVTVNGKGKGGRNQELALSASKFLKKGVLVSCSTDGVDFITDAAGGIVDSTTYKIAKEKKLDFEKYLKNNDSYNYLKKVNGIIKTEKTGTNVGDLAIVLGEK